MSEGRVAVMNDAARDGELDLRAVGRALVRKKWWVFGPALAVAALTFVGVNLITPKYKSEARILIEGRENVFLRPEAEKAGERDRAVDQEAITSQVQLALSRDLARQVIKQLKLGELPEFDSTLRGVSLIRYSLGFLGLAKDPLSMTPEERVLESYYERLTVFPVDKSRVISVEFQSADPELAARVANAVADNYLALQQNARQDQTRAAGRWLSGEIDVLRKRVADAEAKVEEFRSKTNLFIGTNNTMLSNQTLGESNRDLAAARSQKAELESKARFIRDLLKRGGPLESADVDQFRADPPAQRAARDVESAACRAVVHVARQPSAHQGTEGADQRSRPPNSRRGAAACALARKRRPHRKCSRRIAVRRARPAQAAGCLDQRAGCGAARL